jgi:hypothetical protein
MTSPLLRGAGPARHQSARCSTAFQELGASWVRPSLGRGKLASQQAAQGCIQNACHVTRDPPLTPARATALEC